MAAPGDGAPAEDDAPTENNREDAQDEAEDSAGGGPEKIPTHTNRIKQ
jgi:hypothetical protein